MPTSPAEMMAAIIRNLPQKTGKDIEEWKAVARSEAVAAHKSRKEKIAYLQGEYGLGHGQAQTILWEAEKPDDYMPPGDEQLLARQYAGEKHQLPPKPRSSSRPPDRSATTSPSRHARRTSRSCVSGSSPSCSRRRAPPSISVSCCQDTSRPRGSARPARSAAGARPTGSH
jgi:hypothetical protein